MLKEKEIVHSLQQTLAGHLIKFAKTSQEDLVVQIKDACTLDCQLAIVNQRCKQDGLSTGWMSKFNEAITRFQQKLNAESHTWIINVLRDDGPEKALSKIKECEISPCCTFLHQCAAILQIAPLLEKLEPPETTKRLSVMVDRMKDYVTIASINDETCKEIFPDKEDKIRKWKKDISENATGLVAGIKDKISGWKTTADKYRRGSLALAALVTS